MSPQITSPVLAEYLSEAPYVGEPDVAGALAVYPLVGPVPEQQYQSFAQGVAQGVKLTELPGGASVRDLVVHNPTALPVLLLDGEEVLGAQQNRTFDVSVLVPAGARLRVPVSCVEAGRWDDSCQSEPFRPAPQTANPLLRMMKSAQAARELAAGAEPRADQSAVWAEVAASTARHNADAPTSAMHDVFEHRRDDLDEMCAAISMECSQTGMLAWIGDRFAVLDRISQPEALDALFLPLVQGYALDAMDASRVEEPPGVDDARAFLERVLALPVSEQDGIGLGRGARVASDGLVGAGLIVGSELVQLSVFANLGGSSAGGSRARGGRVQRPSRRRS